MQALSDMTPRNRLTRCLAVLLLAFGWAPASFAASIPEPDTVFYGKVINLSGGQPYQMTAGSLEWTIAGVDGQSPITLDCDLEPIDGGEFSYRLEVPADLVASGLTVNAGSLRVAEAETVYAHQDITVNGHAARVAANSEEIFASSQSLRGSTNRVDLEVFFKLPDSDGDGMPDWWEAANGLAVDANDAAGDPDNDGESNLGEYLQGTDPNVSNAQPTLVAETFVAYAGGAIVPLLTVVDSDSGPADLTITVVEAPIAGSLLLRGAGLEGADLTLVAGDSFTLADVYRSAVAYAAPAGSGPADSMILSVVDETDINAESEAEISFLISDAVADGLLAAEELEAAYTAALANRPGDPVFDGLTDAEATLAARFALAANGNVIAGKASTTAAALEVAVGPFSNTTAATPHAIIGGLGPDTLTGGDSDDLIFPGAGSDTIIGGDGADTVYFESTSFGDDTVVGFDAAGGDIINLNGALAGSYGEWTDFITFTAIDSGALITVASENAAASTIRLPGVTVNALEFESWLIDGTIVADIIEEPVHVWVFAEDDAVEEGEESAFILRRSGSTTAPLIVGYDIFGVAVNGTDYPFLDGLIEFPAGSNAIALPLTPYNDGAVESPEVAQLVLKSGNGYRVGRTGTATLTIEDAAPEVDLPVVTIRTLSPIALAEIPAPAYMQLERSGPTADSLAITLRLTGSALNNVDFDYISPVFIFGPGEGTKLLEVMPKTNADLTRGVESLVVSIADSASGTYAVRGNSRDSVSIVHSTYDFRHWRDFIVGYDGGDHDDFPRGDRDRDGIKNLLEFAFGLDPDRADEKEDRRDLPRVSLEHGRLQVEFRRHPASIGLDYIVEVSDDMIAWESGDAFVEEMDLEPEREAEGIACFRDRKAVAEGISRYMRVRVEETP